MFITVRVTDKAL